MLQLFFFVFFAYFPIVVVSNYFEQLYWQSRDNITANLYKKSTTDHGPCKHKITKLLFMKQHTCKQKQCV